MYEVSNPEKPPGSAHHVLFALSCIFWRAAEVRLTKLHFSSLSSFLLFPNPPPNVPRPLRRVNGSEAPEACSSLSDMPEWASVFLNCEGHMQSPININTAAVSFSAKLEPLLLSGYDLPPEEKLSLKNNGHTGEHHGAAEDQLGVASPEARSRSPGWFLIQSSSCFLGQGPPLGLPSHNWASCDTGKTDCA